ncbi:MAG: RICIN domain-containing protein [Saccharothrix sp.]|nr:RICIN domain-containing protein [Saccharothrix sp.]
MGALVVVALVALAVVLSDGMRAPAQNEAASTSAGPTTTEPAPTTSTEPSSQPPTTTAPTTAPQAPPPAAPVQTTTVAAPAPQPPPAPGPRDGIQQIRLAHTGLCLAEVFQTENGRNLRVVLGQDDCAVAQPPTELERLTDGTVRIKLHNAEYGVGCATVDYGGTHDGLLLAGDSCGAGRAEQRFTLEPANGGYRLRSVPGSAYCIGVLGGRTDPGAHLIQGECTGLASQLFILG